MAAVVEAIHIKRGRKFDQVLEGARVVFMRDGFDGANVDDIAASAGVSKATLYSYFPDKRALFVEIAKRECERQADEAEALITLTAPPKCVLPQAARRIIDFLLSDFGRAVYRICIAEADRFPELGQQFYASGPQIIRDRLASYMNGAIARGELVIDDVFLAADQFAELCKADIFPTVIFGVRSDFTQADRDRVADGAVAMFLARYGTDQGRA
ncbi:TetR family transcriptional regulator [Defluviimonas denitrificans]|jgi:AcrR family transcriptional regulator|uniref:TetR family transcriptional regulator n=1 Tax=Albidovulum denitrificans TaxID=404881 RepID=A0A2S8S4D8_9RHOB|nr:TetR/AcrR family transcriptional regulator [Defluviimonas denitrificans]PQV55670.1 TetR family transcriptional regulator [Defluviimonas denitrificans]